MSDTLNLTGIEILAPLLPKFFAEYPDIRVDISRQHRQQYRLADAGAGEDAEPLATATGQKGIERSHAEIERRADTFARMRRRR